MVTEMKVICLYTPTNRQKTNPIKTITKTKGRTWGRGREREGEGEGVWKKIYGQNCHLSWISRWLNCVCVCECECVQTHRIHQNAETKPRDIYFYFYVVDVVVVSSLYSFYFSYIPSIYCTKNSGAFVCVCAIAQCSITHRPHTPMLFEYFM